MDNQKQIVLSSDCSPKQLPHIEERLVSRFQWGLIAEVEPPDHATSEAILRQKAKENGINIDPVVISYIAGKGKSNIRSLEGLIIRLAAQASFQKAKSLLRANQAAPAVQAFKESLELNSGNLYLGRDLTEKEYQAFREAALIVKYDLELLFKNNPEQAQKQGKGKGKPGDGKKDGKPVPGEDPGAMPGKGNRDTI